MNLLITGIHGFVGSNLTTVLKREHVVYGLDIVAPLKEGVVHTYAWEDRNEIPPVDVIIHLAGKAHDTKNQSEAKSYFDINFGLTKLIFDYFLESSASKFVFFSSVKAAADSVGGVLTEEVIPAPKGPYGESKIAAEKYILERLPSADSGKSVIILRPCMIHGPENKGNLNLLHGVVKSGIPWPLGAFENRRSFTSIGNLCYVVERLITQDVPSGIYNMSDDEALSTNELITLMCKEMGQKARIWPISRGLVSSLARMGTMLHLPLNAERLRKLTESYVVSNAKIKQALGLDKMPVSATEGLKRTLRSFTKK